MEQNLENNDWKKEAPLLSGLPMHNPFSVPDKYFHDLSDRITGAVYLADLKLRVTATGFTTPENYFEDLGECIKAEVITERIKSVTAKDKNGYTVPDNYFEQLNSNILARIIEVEAQRPQAKIIRLWHSKLLKYASAACFLIVASIGLYFNQQNPVQKSSFAEFDNEQMLYDIDEQVIIDHLEANSFEQPSSNVSDAALESYILNNYSQNDLSSDL